ncbi:MAG: hypothetical protein P1U61_07730 [Legionellaceae bacterium]|nr:hypothetical protein [Legionellaceae bacterium]
MFSKRELELDFEALLAPYLYLDESLFKGEEDGDACFKKFSNQGQGTPRFVWMKLEKIAQDILSGAWEPKADERLNVIDVLTLYSNHLDQQRYNEKPELKEKERLVVTFLKAAHKISPIYDYENLSQYTPRELSSHDQMLHYLGKAERYEHVAVEQRIEKLLASLKIAIHLSALSCSKLDDPHAFKNRVSTRELPVNYCYQDLNRFDDAAALMLPQISSESAFHRTQAHIQLAQIYSKKFQHDHHDAAVVLEHAHAAVDESHSTGSTLLEYNARVCLMNAFQLAGEPDQANSIAHAIIDEMDHNETCGAKPLHREAADKVLSLNQPTVTPGL